jgi:hypothetical protein
MRRLLGVTLLAACAQGPSNEIAFHGEVPVLPGFSFDTGMQPPGSPVQLQLMFSAGGALVADARAIAGGDGDALAVAAVPGSGAYSLAAHVKLDAMLHVDVGGLKYDGPIPGIENVDISFGGETTFDPFLIDGSAEVVATLPDISLPNIPLPGGLPGHLALTIASGSTIASTLSGRCASFEQQAAQFLATTSTRAQVLLDAEIVLQVPVVGERSFPLPRITVDVPAVSVDMDLGQHEFAGGGEPPSGSLATSGSCDGSGGGGGGGGTCGGPLTDFDSAYHPPNGFHQNACSTTQLARFDAACLSATATNESCQNFRFENVACSNCLLTPSTSPGYGPIVIYKAFATYNIPGCIALLAPSELGCAKQIQTYLSCLDAACGACGSTAERDACFDDADRTSCVAYASSANTCLDRLANDGPAATCFFDFDYPAQFCGP